MNKTRLLIASVLSMLLFAHHAPAITADALASFLGVTSWQTTIDLPAESYSIEVMEFRDDKVTDRYLISQPEWTRKPESGVTIMAGPDENKYKIAVTFSSGDTLSVKTKVALFETPTYSTRLPEKIQEGDFVLFGQPKKTDVSRGPNDLGAYFQGFLLRIKKIN